MEHPHAYGRLAAMAGLSFVSMYILMYAMVDRPGYVYASLNQAYMAGLMTAPMILFELWLMRSIYANRRLNAALIVLSVVAGVGCFLLIRDQTAIGDREFIRSMIPHHSGAILMCREAPLQAPDLRSLCEQIIRSQQQEIDQMQALLRR